MSKNVNDIVYDASIAYLAVQAGEKPMPQFLQELDRDVSALRNFKKDSFDPRKAYDEARRHMASPHMQGAHIKVIRTMAIGHGIENFSPTDHYATLDVYLRKAFEKTVPASRQAAQSRL